MFSKFWKYFNSAKVDYKNYNQHYIKHDEDNNSQF